MSGGDVDDGHDSEYTNDRVTPDCLSSRRYTMMMVSSTYAAPATHSSLQVDGNSNVWPRAAVATAAIVDDDDVDRDEDEDEDGADLYVSVRSLAMRAGTGD